MFMGEYNHSLDAKGRVIVPAKFREQLGDVFVISQGLDGCLFVFPRSEWTKFEEKLKELPMSDKNARKFVRFFLAGASETEIDKQGRILIPPVLREFAGLTKDITFVGVGGRAEIWSADRWNESTSFDDMDEVAQHMSELGI
ncbi:division/cell wall cluster transcriptional repressor MraZ [uncultured Methanobrevibacter sp.]|uniref:division/cell wall cluster transcriptional repressor MraZ n=1 Tax=uncultured Methanobrevibacter sp. TaxID=253161 RepID=UPI00262B669B